MKRNSLNNLWWLQLRISKLVGGDGVDKYEFRSYGEILESEADMNRKSPYEKHKQSTKKRTKANS